MMHVGTNGLCLCGACVEPKQVTSDVLASDCTVCLWHILRETCDNLGKLCAAFERAALLMRAS